MVTLRPTMEDGSGVLAQGLTRHHTSEFSTRTPRARRYVLSKEIASHPDCVSID